MTAETTDSKALQSRGTTVLIGASLVFYLLVSAACYYDGFFRHFGPSLRYTPGGAALFVDGAVRWSIIPWARIPIFFATLLAFGVSARALWRGRPDARLICFFTFFGLVVPQAGHMAIYLVAFRHVPLATAVLAGLALVGIPAVALGRPQMIRRFGAHEAGASWAGLRFGGRRLLLTVIYVAWLGFAAELYLGSTSFLSPGLGYVAASLVIAAGGLAILGLLRLRTWGIFAALFSSIVTGVMLASAYRIWLELGFLKASPGTAWVVSGAALAAPVLLQMGLVWPFVVAFGRRLRSAAAEPAYLPPNS